MTDQQFLELLRAGIVPDDMPDLSKQTIRSFGDGLISWQETLADLWIANQITSDQMQRGLELIPSEYLCEMCDYGHNYMDGGPYREMHGIFGNYKQRADF